MEKVLHVIDDEKFIPYCKVTFAIRHLENVFCKSEKFEERLNESDYDFIVIHYLNPINAATINKHQKKAPIIWFFWGADVFDLGKFHNKFLLPNTRSLRKKLAYKEGFIPFFKYLVKSVFPSIADFQKENKTVIKAFTHIDVVVPVMPGDYFLLKQQYLIKAPLFHLNYVSPVLNKPEYNFSGPSAKNILLGNSASYSNNHLEAIDRLSTISLNDKKVIIPLSYGDKMYANYISLYAEKKLGSNAYCLMDFMPFQEYLSTIESCGIVIMNHLRQQAVGNVIQALLNGSHLYLNNSSTLFQFLKQEKFIVSDNEWGELRNLSVKEQKINFERCLEVFGKEKQHSKIKDLLKNTPKYKNSVKSEV